MMKKLLILMLALTVAALPALAGEGHDHAIVKPAADDVQLGTLHVANNVVSLHDGQKTALCACGSNFDVTEKSPSFSFDGGTYFLCGEGCKAKIEGMDEETKAGAVPGLQKAVLTSEHLMSNEMIKDGKKMATCACGQTFEVKTETPRVIADGMCMDACCGGCAQHVLKASAEERAAMMKKVMHSDHSH